MAGEGVEAEEVAEAIGEAEEEVEVEARTDLLRIRGAGGVARIEERGEVPLEGGLSRM